MIQKKTPKTPAKIVVEPKSGAKAAKIWMSRFDRVRKWRAKHPMGDKQWIMARRLAIGDHWDSKDDAGEGTSSENLTNKVVVNRTGALVEDYQAFLFNRDAKWDVEPSARVRVSTKERMAARVQGSLLNYVWREREMRRPLKRSVADIVTIGNGVIRTGFDPTATARQSGNTIDYTGKTDGLPYGRHVNPFLFWYDPDAEQSDLKSARWAAEARFRLAQDVIADSNWNAKVIAKVKSGEYTPTTKKSFLDQLSRDASSLTQQKHILQNVGLDEDVEADDSFVVIEIWDKKFKKVWYFLHGVPEPLLVSEWLYKYLDDFPYVYGKFIEFNDQPLGMGAPIRVKDQQLELNRHRTAQVQMRRKLDRRLYWAWVDALESEAELSKFTSGADDVIRVNKPGQALGLIDDPGLARSGLQMEEILNEDFRIILSQDPLLSGGKLPSRTSAAEVRERASLTGAKLDALEENVLIFVTDVGRQILAHLQFHMRSEGVVRITGAGPDDWVPYTAEDIKAETTLSLSTVSKPKIDAVTERSHALQYLQVFGQLAQQNFLPEGTNAAPLIRWISEKFEGVPIEEIFPMMAGANPAAGTLPSAPGERVGQDDTAPVDPNSISAGLAGAAGGLG